MVYTIGLKKMYIHTFCGVTVTSIAELDLLFVLPFILISFLY